MLSQVVTNQAGKQRENHQEVVDTTRVHEFLRMNPPSFTGLSVTEDPENFIEELQKVFKIMHVADVERVELATHQLKSVARIWFDQLKKNRTKDAPIDEFICCWIVSSVKQERKGRYADRDMHIARIMIYVQQVEKDKLMDREEFKNKRAKTSRNESRQKKGNANRSSFQQKQNGPAPSSSSAPIQRNKGATQGCVVMAPLVVSWPEWSFYDRVSKEQASVSTPVGESILAERVYHDCTIFVNCKSTMADLVELDMVDSDVILGMDWLHACYALVDYRN
ncbi:hypothetical protein H5410_036817 [Solanum commersonii]|uniref:Gag-pol polyprotein n=1 Tax=Solanum commersonii TaxID=4109 RepID=A0A9J5Y5C5_SOLCO|nr:hypothetical protein H5410_036817 [Solanum commersonii]